MGELRVLAFSLYIGPYRARMAFAISYPTISVFEIYPSGYCLV